MLKDLDEKINALEVFTNVCSVAILTGLIKDFENIVDVSTIKETLLLELIQELKIEAPIINIDRKIQVLESINIINQQAFKKAMITNPTDSNHLFLFDKDKDYIEELINDLKELANV